MADQNQGIDQLVNLYGEDTVAKAFWLQQEIYEQGLDAAHFTDAAEDEMNQRGPMLIKAAIENEFKRNI